MVIIWISIAHCHEEEERDTHQYRIHHPSIPEDTHNEIRQQGQYTFQNVHKDRLSTHQYLHCFCLFRFVLLGTWKREKKHYKMNINRKLYSIHSITWDCQQNAIFFCYPIHFLSFEFSAPHSIGLFLLFYNYFLFIFRNCNMSINVKQMKCNKFFK